MMSVGLIVVVRASNGCTNVLSFDWELIAKPSGGCDAVIFRGAEG